MNQIYSDSLSCHKGPVEVVQNLFCGSEEEAYSLVTGPVIADTLIPLNTLNAHIWDMGFYGEVLYYPIRDYGILPTEIMNSLVTAILDRINAGKKVALFCLGGHGRTGYVASVVLGRLGYDDPIGYLRTHYCEQAVESTAQVKHIAEILDKPELLEQYTFGPLTLYNEGFWEGFDLELGANTIRFQMFEDAPVCGACGRRLDGVCQTYKVWVDPDEPACEEYLDPDC